MTEKALIRPISSIAWELRSCWARGWRVSLRLDRADVERVEGIVSAVSATGATAKVGDWLVPLDRVLSLHRPSRLGDSDFRDGGRERWAGYVPRALRRDSRQTEMELET